MLPEGFDDEDWVERDFLPMGHSEYTLSIEVKKITVQPSTYKPVSLEPVELEILRLKRELVSLHVKEDSKDAEVTAVIEFRGKGLTLSLTEGDCDVGQVAWKLSKFYYSRYDKVGVKIHSPPYATKLCDCTLENPAQFADMLHLIRANGGLKVDVWIEKSSQPFGRNSQMETFKLGSKVPQPFP